MQLTACLNIILIGFLVGSEKRVGNIYSKASSFVDYVRRALRKLDLDESKVRGGDTENEGDTNCFYFPLNSSPYHNSAAFCQIYCNPSYMLILVYVSRNEHIHLYLMSFYIDFER